jgi:hypothetical protein
MTSVTNVRFAWPLDVTLMNLADLLNQSLETSARLRACAADAAHEGLDTCVQVYEDLDWLERRQIFELEKHLERQLGAALADPRRRRDTDAERTD